MQDKSINGALLALRKDIIRGKLDGLECVEALLTLRGVEMPRVMPRKRPDAARRGHMSRMVLESLRAGPMPMRELASCIAAKRPEISQKAAYIRTGQALAKLRNSSRVCREGRLWALALLGTVENR